MNPNSIQVISISDLEIPEARQRREFSAEQILDLAASIDKNSLLHPPVVRPGADGKFILIAGWRRLKAIQNLWEMSKRIRWADFEFPEGQLPCTLLSTLDSLDAFEIELEENIQRADLSWQDRAVAESQLFELRRLQAEKNNECPPSIAQVAAEIDSTDYVGGEPAQRLRAELIVSKHLDDPDIQKASSAQEALKILRRKEETQRRAELGAALGNLKSSSHTLLKGDCLEILPTLPAASFDVILSDPPYGIDAQNFNDSGGLAGGGGDGSHFYDDSLENWQRLMAGFIPETFRLAKPLAHLYLFCDIERFLDLRERVRAAGWKPFRTPLVWFNPTANRVPWVDSGPQRKYQLILYATKGNRHVTRIYPDVIECTSDPNPGHPAAKPVALYRNLLLRSVIPGNTVIDPFAGSGVVFPAANAEKVLATGIEQDPAAYAIAAKRLEELK